MGWEEFVIELFDKLAWPISAIVLVIILRKELASIVGNLRSLKYKELSLEFGEKLEEAKKEADKAKLPEISARLSRVELEYYGDLARASPRAAVIEAWLQIETAVEKIIRRPPEGRPRSFGPEARVLLEIAGLEKEEISIFYDLRTIRNRVVHEEDARVSEAQAIEYVQLALRLASKITEKFDN